MKRFLFADRGFLVLLSALSSAAHAANDNQANMQAALAQRLINAHFAIWNDPENDDRAATFAHVYSRDVTVADYAGIATGYAEVDALLTRVQTQHPGFRFTPDPVNWNHGVGRVTWGYGPSAAPNTVRGEDIFTIKNGKVSSFRVFLN